MYALVFSLGAIFSFFKENKVFFVTLLIVLMLLGFFRFGVGPDYFSYQYLYQGLSSNPYYELMQGTGNQEVLFRVIGSFLKSINFSYQMYLAVICFVNVYFIGRICSHFSKKATMSLFLYYSFFYFVWTFSGLRQGLVIAIGCYYYLKCYKENKHIYFIVLSLILSLIHASALILIFFYVLSQFSWTGKKLTILSFISVLISILPLGPLIALFSNVPLLDRIYYYLPTSYSFGENFDIQSLARIVFLIFGLVCYDIYTRKNKINAFTMNFYILSLNLYFLMKTSELVAARLSIYGFFMVILILPNIYTMYKTRINRLIFQLILLVFCFLYFNKELNAMEELSDAVLFENEFIPYTHVFNKNQGYYFDNRYLDIINPE